MLGKIGLFFRTLHKKRMAQAVAGEGGQGLLEFALVVPVFVLLVGGVIDLGLAAYTKMTLQDVSCAAVRSVSETMASVNTANFDEVFEQNIRDAFVESGYLVYDEDNNAYVGDAQSLFGEGFGYTFETELHTDYNQASDNAAYVYNYHHGSGRSYSTRTAFYCYEDIRLTVTCTYKPKTFVMQTLLPNGINFETTSVSQVRIDY